MLNGVGGHSTSALLQQMQKSEGFRKSVAESDARTIDKTNEIKESINNGQYKLDNESTARKMALYLLNKE